MTYAQLRSHAQNMLFIIGIMIGATICKLWFGASLRWLWIFMPALAYQVYFTVVCLRAIFSGKVNLNEETE